MFDFTTMRSRRAPRVSLFTTLTAVILHAAAVMIIAVTALSATAVVPVARSIPAFMAAPAPPPPPPPPPAVREAPRKASARKTRPAVIKPAPVPHAPAPAAGATPVEAPFEILPETEFAPDTGAFDFDIGSEHGVTGGIPGGIAGGIGEATEVIVPSPPPAPREPVRVGGHIVAPRVVHRVDPQYPRVARDARVRGVVILEAVVNPQGRVATVRVLRSHPLLQDAAVAAVRRWRYEPLLLNGTPSPFVLTVTVAFNLR